MDQGPSITAVKPPDFTEDPSSVSTFSQLKRRASPSFDCLDNGRKRMKEDNDDDDHGNHVEPTGSDSSVKLAIELLEQLYCGCCSGLVYKPVLVMPCQHFFCGSCCMLWIRNGGTNCPACRSLATVAMPFRAIQPIIDTLLQTTPQRSRTEREIQQADEVYKIGHSIRFPPPREASPAPDMERSTDYVHPCPHCIANNQYDWRCPQPIPDPILEPDHAWHVDDGVPPGHAHCGNCENLLALRAPTTTKCDLCQISFCGIGVQDRCIALPITAQLPHNMTTHADLIQSPDVYECFGGNTVEVEIMLEYAETQKLTPRHIYRDIIQHIQKQPNGFQPLIELDLFSDIYAVSPSGEVSPDAPRNRACRLCAAEIFLWGLKDWWVRERRKGFLEEEITKRVDCPEGRTCVRQKDDHAHAREFNHVFASHEIVDDQPNVDRSNVTDLPGAMNSVSDAILSTSTTSTLSLLLNADPDSQHPGQNSSAHNVQEVVDAST